MPKIEMVTRIVKASRIFLYIMFKEAMLKALVPVTIITFTGIMALAPLYVTLGVMTRQINSEK